MKKFKGTAPRVITDMPDRIFDLPPYFDKKYGDKEVLFAGKENGQWIKYNSQRFIEITNYISSGLLKIGVEKGDRIALIANNCPEWNMIDFAIQQIGAICIPIYPTVSHADYEYIFKHSEAKIVFVFNKSIYSKIADIIPQIPAIQNIYTIRPIDDIKPLEHLINIGKENLDLNTLDEIKSGIKRNDVATILYTSGTMGTPKGVMLSHRNILAIVEYLCPVYPIDEKHTALSYLPLSHIYERCVQYCHVYLGVSTYYCENVGTIVDNLAEIKPDHLSSVPRLIEKVYSTMIRKGRKLKGIKKMVFFWALGLARRYDETERTNGWIYRKKLAVADKLVFSEFRKVFGGNMKLIISGGAAIQSRLVKTFKAIGIPLIEGYGLTETSPVVCTNSMVTGRLKAGTVGDVLGNQEVKIDENGEILIKGPNVMVGYYKDEAMTKEVIDENGFFHTGDVGKFDSDGMLMITGRIKEIFKTSMGKYISPALIENKFAESPFIGEIMVVGEGKKFAAAIIIPNFEYLRNWCTAKKIEYTSDKEMVKNKDIVNRFKKEIDKYNKTLGDFEQVKKFELIDHEWTIESGEITASLKIRRAKIRQSYKDIIDKIYAES